MGSRAALSAITVLLAFASPARAAEADDRDGDGVVDFLDNCLLRPNPFQRDTDRDGFGNACDPDFNQDGLVDVEDQRLLVEDFAYQPHGVCVASPPPSCAPPPGIEDGVDPLRSRDFDLDGDGRVDPRDLEILLSFRGRPPGPRLDSDGDGASDGEDPCWTPPAGSLLVRPGCTALDIVQRPESLTGPIVTVLGDLVDELTPAVEGIPGLRDIRLALQGGAGSLEDASRTLRSGAPCAAEKILLVIESHLLSTAAAFDPLIAQVLEERPDYPDHGDAPVEHAAASALRIWQARTHEAGNGVHDVGDAVRTACAVSGAPSPAEGTVLRVRDDEGRIELEDGRIFGLAASPQGVGTLAEGVSLSFAGLDFGDGTGIVTAWQGPEPALGEASACIVPRFVPIQRMAPLFPGPYLTHDPAGYLVDGEYQLEQGMRIGVRSDCVPSGPPTPLPPAERFSLEVRISYTSTTGQAVTDHLLAPDLDPQDVPVPLPVDIAPHSLAQLQVRARKQLCEPGPVACQRPTVFATRELSIRVRPRGSYCSATPETAILDVNDQVVGAFRTTSMESGFSPFPRFGGVFAAEAHAPDGSGAVLPIGIGDPFAVYSEDFFPVFPAFGVSGALQAAYAQAVTGVNHAAGVRWPHENGSWNGAEFQYSCSVPKIVRDVVNFCEGPDAYYRLPFADYRLSLSENHTDWTQGQGNLPGCCGDAFSSSCCESHNFSYAYDMIAPCGTVIRAARAGRVVQVDEGFFEQVTSNCTVNECPLTGCCPDTSCGANQIIVRHQDGSFARYLHLRVAGALPEVGDLVRRGEHIAYMGTTGPSSGPHLHYEVREDLNAGSPPFGTILALFEAVHPTTEEILTCYEPHNRPPADSPHRLLRSNNQPWP